MKKGKGRRCYQFHQEGQLQFPEAKQIEEASLFALLTYFLNDKVGNVKTHFLKTHSEVNMKFTLNSQRELIKL